MKPIGSIGTQPFHPRGEVQSVVPSAGFECFFLLGNKTFWLRSSRLYHVEHQPLPPEDHDRLLMASTPWSC